MFRQFSPRQSPHAATQLSPYFLQEHRFDPHGFFESFLHLQRINLRNVSGATGRFVVIGTNPSSSIFHPQSNGLSAEVSRFFHTTTCRCTRKAWYLAAPSVGGNFSGTNPELLFVIMSWNLTYLKHSIHIFCISSVMSCLSHNYFSSDQRTNKQVWLPPSNRGSVHMTEYVNNSWAYCPSDIFFSGVYPIN